MNDFFEYTHSAQHMFFDAGRIPDVAIALILVSVIGVFTGAADHKAIPLLWQGLDKSFGLIGARIDKKSRKRSDLVFRGFIFSAFMIVFAVLLGKGLEALNLSYNFYGVLDIAILSLMLSSGAVWNCIARVLPRLEDKKGGKGDYTTLARSARCDLNSLDDHGVARISLGFLSVSFDKMLCAPIFWFLAGGLPLVILYSVVAYIVWRFGKHGFSKGFGVVPSSIEAVMGAVPHYLASLAVILATAAVPGAGVVRSVKGLVKSAPYGQGGVLLSVLAHGFKVSLGGPCKDLDGSTINAVWCGPEGASAKIPASILKNGIYIFVTAHIILLAALLAAYIFAF